jgi:hypothetical protein
LRSPTTGLTSCRPPYARGILRNDAAIQVTPTNGSRNSTSDPVGRGPRGDAPANQQKVVVAREFARDLRLLVLDQPPRLTSAASSSSTARHRQARRETAILQSPSS